MAKRQSTQKQTVFLSHIHADEVTAKALERVIKRALLGGVDVFNSSNRKSIELGQEWRDVIINQLRSCQVLLALVTPESINAPWVNFEAGGVWVTGNRVIPCCAKGMAPRSLPAPFSHLHGMDLSSKEDLQTLIRQLAEVAELDAPIEFNYEEAIKEIIASWDEKFHGRNEEFQSWIHKVLARPKRYAGEVCVGTVRLDSIDSVTPIEAKQFREGEIVAGDSIRCMLRPVGSGSETLRYCFANGRVADLFSQADPQAAFEVQIKCLEQIRVFISDFTDFEYEDRGIEYHSAFLVVNEPTLVRT